MGDKGDVYNGYFKTINDNKNFHLSNANHISMYYIFEGNFHTI